MTSESALRTAFSATPAAWDATTIERLLAAPARSATGWTGQPPPGRPLILLTAGVPDAPTFPVAEIGAAVRTVLEREPAQALAYLLGTPQGEPELRELVVSRMEPEPGLTLSAANVTITSGAAQALANIAETFLDPGDTAIIEAPSYGGAIRAMLGSGGKLVSVPVDEHGMRVDAFDETLERLRATGERVKLIYTMPTFHNPAGTTMPVERRRQLLEVASRARVLIVEDDAYSTLRYRGEPVPSLFALAGGVGVLRCGTVSKTIAPGLRVGWIKGQPELINALVRMRFDNGTSPFVQRIVIAYVQSGAFEPHAELVRRVYQQKFEAMDAAMGEYCARYASWTEPEGGFYLWVRLPEGVDCVRLQEIGLEEGVGFFLGTAFYADGGADTGKGGGRDYIRLAFSAVPLEQIREGCARLGRSLARAVA